MTLKRSLKVIQTATIRKLGVSYLPSIVMSVSLTVYEICSVKELRYLENWVRGCSKSLKTAPFDKGKGKGAYSSS